MSRRVDIEGDRGTYVVCCWSVSKLAREDIQDFPISPALFTVCIVGEMIWVHSSQSIVEKVWPRPGIGGSGDYRRWRSCFLVSFGGSNARLDNSQSHC